MPRNSKAKTLNPEPPVETGKSGDASRSDSVGDHLRRLEKMAEELHATAQHLNTEAILRYEESIAWAVKTIRGQAEELDGWRKTAPIIKRQAEEAGDEIKRLREGLEKYADTQNWECANAQEGHECGKYGVCNIDLWNGPGEGQDIARETLIAREGKS